MHNTTKHLIDLYLLSLNLVCGESVSWVSLQFNLL